MVDFLEVIHQIINDGASWSTAIAVILGVLKVKEGIHKRKIDTEIRHDIKDIKKELGICDLPQSTSKQRITLYTKKYSDYLRRGTKLENQLRRKSMKPNPINPFTLTLAILGAGKMILESFGVDLIDDNQINDIANGVAAVVTIVGVVMSHRRVKVKEVVTNGQSTFTVPTESTK